MSRRSRGRINEERHKFWCGYSSGECDCGLAWHRKIAGLCSQPPKSQEPK